MQMLQSESKYDLSFFLFCFQFVSWSSVNILQLTLMNNSLSGLVKCMIIIAIINLLLPNRIAAVSSASVSFSESAT